MFKKLGILTILIVLALVGSVPAVSGQSQALATGSIHIQPFLSDPFGNDFIQTDVHINFNARRIYNEDNEIAATGHLFWREDGQVNRVSIATMTFQFWGMPECAWITGEVYDGPRAGQFLCLVICDEGPDAPDWILGNYWRDASGAPLAGYSSATALSGNVVIKE
ncbi:MAG: hypothetical protein ACNA70_03270 [Brevefilum sp.]